MARVVWTEAAISDVDHIAEFISSDAPYRASIFIEELILSTDRLEDFPLIGRVVPEKGDPTIRELLFSAYRIIYRNSGSVVTVLHVFHGARLFDDPLLG